MPDSLKQMVCRQVSTPSLRASQGAPQPPSHLPYLRPRQQAEHSQGARVVVGGHNDPKVGGHRNAVEVLGGVGRGSVCRATAQKLRALSTEEMDKFGRATHLAASWVVTGQAGRQADAPSTELVVYTGQAVHVLLDVAPAAAEYVPTGHCGNRMDVIG